MTTTGAMQAMTPEAKRQLSTTIRALRERLLDELHSATDSTYRLPVRARDAGLDERTKARRRRLEAWIREQVRAQPPDREQRSEEDFRLEAEKQAAYTFLNRIVVLRLMEAPGPNGEPLRKPSVLSEGWESPAYSAFRKLAPALVRGDETEGYAFLLKLVFEDLARDMPGLFGHAGISELIPIPAPSLRHVVEELAKPELESCWTDDMTLGWVYQYWNDPERENLDKKINPNTKWGSGKIEPHEIASKTQMFTERYIVDWLLQNSLGPMWLAMCKKHGWTPLVESDGVLDELERRRKDWRAKREAEEVSLTELMPLHSEAERRWAYYVLQPIPDDAAEKAPETVRDLKILDPAVGSGHFLVVAMDLLLALYREEARHRGEVGDEQWSNTASIERILSHNLHGIDLDPRAVQIAAATLWLKAQQLAPEAQLERMNLVASNLRLACLPDNDPALVELRREVERETGISGELTDTIVHALQGADHLGSLLKIDEAVESALEQHEKALGRLEPDQGDLIRGYAKRRKRVEVGAEEARSKILEGIEDFLNQHSAGDDLGLRLRGEQLVAGVRFARMVREGVYDLVVANPPYQGTSKLASASYIDDHYAMGKADLYAAFLLRGLELARDGGVSAMLTMRNWMFIDTYATKQSRRSVRPGLREHVLTNFDLRALGDFDRGAFEEILDEVVSVVVSVVQRAPARARTAAQCPTPRDDRTRDTERTKRKRAATLCHLGIERFEPDSLRVVPEWPIVYWWSADFLSAYSKTELLGESSPASKGLGTGNDRRFTRFWWEAPQERFWVDRDVQPSADDLIAYPWVPYIKGGKGRRWYEPLVNAINWRSAGLELHMFDTVSPGVAIRNRDLYFVRGIAFTKIGHSFAARVHRFLSIFGDAGQSVFPTDIPSTVVRMNTAETEFVLRSLNPTQNFMPGDIDRIPLIEDDPKAGEILDVLETAFSTHESVREPSAEFKQPGRSSWRHAQEWARKAINREAGVQLDVFDCPPGSPELAIDHLSYALGVTLGRFSPAGEGTLDPRADDLSHALPDGILFLDRTRDAESSEDGLGHPACAELQQSWSSHREEIQTEQTNLRDWLALDFFQDVHKSMYENRPIYWPLSSSSRTFVAWVNIHRFNDQTLRTLLANHLVPALARVEGELSDVQSARRSSNKTEARGAERRHATLDGFCEEMRQLIAAVEQCADKGPPPTSPRSPPRDADAGYDPDLDDGVMINSAALWPLLAPQWGGPGGHPRAWWEELAKAKGKKDYDWSHLAMKYWPDRVDKKCKKDPSLGVAHGCFWKYHPQKAWAWELRLQDEIGPDFRIEEASYRGDGGDKQHRNTYLRDKPAEALATVEKEILRRRGRGKSAKPVAEMNLLEPGLWSVLPDACWELETKISTKQKQEFRLRAPDEAAARAKLEAANPKLVEKRRTAELAFKQPKLFAEGDEKAKKKTKKKTKKRAKAAKEARS